MREIGLAGEGAGRFNAVDQDENVIGFRAAGADLGQSAGGPRTGHGQSRNGPQDVRDEDAAAGLDHGRVECGNADRRIRGSERNAGGGDIDGLGHLPLLRPRGGGDRQQRSDRE